MEIEPRIVLESVTPAEQGLLVVIVVVEDEVVVATFDVCDDASAFGRMYPRPHATPTVRAMISRTTVTSAKQAVLRFLLFVN